MTDEYGKVHTDGSRSGGQPVVAQQKALAVANNLLGINRATLGELSHQELMMALVHIVQQSEAFKQEVSDIVDAYVRTYINYSEEAWKNLNSLIIPKSEPDLLVDVFDECFNQNVLEGETWSEAMARKTRAALEARGLEIREKGQ